METIEIDRLRIEELSLLKGGIWVLTDKGLIWIDDTSIHDDGSTELLVSYSFAT